MALPESDSSQVEQCVRAVYARYASPPWDDLAAGDQLWEELWPYRRLFQEWIIEPKRLSVAGRNVLVLLEVVPRTGRTQRRLPVAHLWSVTSGARGE